MDRAAARMEHCPLCGNEFDPEGLGCRPSCPMSKGCQIVCCPNCHYSFPLETGLARALRGFVDRIKEKKAVQ